MKKEILTPEKKEAIERSLIPRLQKMGFLLLFLSSVSFFYAMISTLHTDDDGFTTPQEMTRASGLDLSDSPLFMLTKEEKIKFYAVSAIFCLVGTTCIFAAKKRIK